MIEYLYYCGLLEEKFKFVSSSCVALKIINNTLQAVSIPRKIGISIEQLEVRSKKYKYY